MKRFAVPVITLVCGVAIGWLLKDSRDTQAKQLPQHIPVDTTRIMVSRPEVADESGRKNHMLRIQTREQLTTGMPIPKPSPTQWVFTLLDDKETTKTIVIVADSPSPNRD